jgi:dUTPase
MTLYIYAGSEEIRDMLNIQIAKHRYTDSGFDIPMVEQFASAPMHSFNLGIHVAATYHGQNRPCILLPRSSLANSRFRMGNSLGLIDSGYRGEVQAKVDCDESAAVAKGTRYFQICQHSFLAWDSVVLVDSLEDLPDGKDTRGSGGFGSTGLQLETHART